MKPRSTIEILTAAYQHVGTLVMAGSRDAPAHKADVVDCIAEAAPSSARNALTALRLVHRTTGASDLRKWSSEHSEAEMRDAISQAYDLAAAQ